MRNSIVSKRYAVLCVALMSVVSTASLAVAAPICAQVLKAPPTGEQISALFDDLAMMSLQADSEKAQGLRTSFLQTELKKKTAEVLKELSIEMPELKKELKSRVALLQGQELTKREDASRVRQKQEFIAGGAPRFRLTMSARALPMKNFIGFTPAGRTGYSRVIELEQMPGDNIKSLVVTNPLTMDQVVLSKEVVNAVIDPTGENIIAFNLKSHPQFPMGKTEISVYSVYDLGLKAIHEFNWSEPDLNVYKNARQISIAPDGDSFSMLGTNNQVVSSRFSNLNSVKREYVSSPKEIISTGSHEFISSSETTVILTKTTPTLVRSTSTTIQSYVKKMMPLENDLILVMGPNELIKLNTKNLKTESSVTHSMSDMVIFKYDFNTYVIGIENGKVVLKDLDNLDGKSFLDLHVLPPDLQAERIYLSANKKGVIVQGSTSKDQNYYWYLELLGEKQ